MATLLLKNPDLVNQVDLPDLSGTFVAPGDEILMSGFSQTTISKSADLVTALNDGTLILSNGIDDFPPGIAINLVRGLQYQEFNDDGRPVVISSTKPKGTVGYFTGRGDDITNGIVGAGDFSLFDVIPGNTDFVDLYFLEDVQFDRGIVEYDNAKLGSWIQMEILAPPGYPYPNNNKTGGYDFINGSFEPNPTNTGDYDINPDAETIVNRYVNHIHLLGFGTVVLKTPEPGKIPKGYFTRISVHNKTSATINLECIVSMLLFRTKTL